MEPTTRNRCVVPTEVMLRATWITWARCLRVLFPMYFLVGILQAVLNEIVLPLLLGILNDVLLGTLYLNLVEFALTFTRVIIMIQSLAFMEEWKPGAGLKRFRKVAPATWDLVTSHPGRMLVLAAFSMAIHFRVVDGGNEVVFFAWVGCLALSFIVFLRYLLVYYVFLDTPENDLATIFSDARALLKGKWFQATALVIIHVILAGFLSRYLLSWFYSLYTGFPTIQALVVFIVAGGILQGFLGGLFPSLVTSLVHGIALEKGIIDPSKIPPVLGLFPLDILKRSAGADGAFRADNHERALNGSAEGPHGMMQDSGEEGDQDLESTRIYTTCPACGAPVPLFMERCSGCGATFQRCRYCGHGNKPGEKTCKGCGAVLSGQ